MTKPYLILYEIHRAHVDTGLIPYSYGSWLDKTQTMSTKNKQPVGLIAQGVELCQWFPEDVNLQNNCLALAEDTIEYFDGEGQSTLSHHNGENNSGLFGWVDVETGSKPRILLTLTHDYGAVAKALAYLAQKTDNLQLRQWADQKLEFVWQNRMNPNLSLFTRRELSVRD